MPTSKEVTLTPSTVETVNLGGPGARIEVVNTDGLGTVDFLVNPGAVAAQGTLTIAEPVTDGDTFTIDTKTYRLKTTIAQGYDIAIGGSEAQTKLNIVAAINGTGAPGIDYWDGVPVHPTVYIDDFSGDTAVLTAKTGGTAGNAIVLSETFTDVANVFDDTTMGTTTAGAESRDPTVGGDDQWKLPASVSSRVVPGDGGSDVTVKLISGAAVTATVTALDS